MSVLPDGGDCVQEEVGASAKCSEVADASGRESRSSLWNCRPVEGCSDGGEASTEACSSDGGSDVSAAQDGNDDRQRPPSPADLQFDEDRLRRQVPQLLETMNRASEEVNSLERQVHAAQARYHSNIAQCDGFYAELRRKSGPTFDRVKAYLAVVQEVKAASHRLQTMARDFSTTGIEISRLEAAGAAEDEVAPWRRIRDNHEQEYVRALSGHRSAQQALDSLRAQIGDAAIQCTMPAFNELQERQLKLVVDHSRLNTLTERATVSKQTYQSSMRELERISSAVHDIRRLHAERTVKA